MDGSRAQVAKESKVRHPEVIKNEASPPASPSVKPANQLAETVSTPIETVKVTEPIPISGEKQATITISALGNGNSLFSIDSQRINTGDSVLTATQQAAKASEVKLVAQGLGFTAYVAGIGGLKEFDQGPLSGWLYKVNGQYPGIGCGIYKLKPGDKVEWIYTVDGKQR